jgi:hypothetical protein
MGMRIPILTVLAAAAAFAFPSRAVAGGAIIQARAAASDPVSFDGARSRPEGDLVRPGSSTDLRTPEQIAKDEQVKADARAQVSLKGSTPGVDKEIAPPAPSKWITQNLMVAGAAGALTGMLIGSLWGMTGLGIGLLVGFLIAYGVNKLKS